MMAMNKIIPALVAFCVTVSVALRAGLAGADDPHDHRLRARRRLRHRRPYPGASAGAAARQASNRGEQAGRRRHPRQRIGRQCGARWLHARRHDRWPDHRRGGAQGHALRYDGVDAGGASRDREHADGGAAGFRREQPQGPGRARQSAAGQGHLRQSGLQCHPAFCRRTAQADCGHRHAERVVSQFPGSHQCGAWQACGFSDRNCVRGARPDSGRHA